MKKIVFTGGGTYGHAMPNVYLIDDLKSTYMPYYIGSDGIEKRFVKNKVKKYYTIPCVKLVRGKIFTNFKIPFVLINSIFKAKKALKEINPDVVFSKGGYVALPVCIAAKMLKIPIVAHESDYSFGLANKMILKRCNTMCVNFQHLEKQNPKITYTGPILSADFENNTKKYNNGAMINGQTLKLSPNKPTMLIVGGSLGAVKVNEMVFKIAGELEKSFNIIHITGKGNNKLKSFGNYNSVEIVESMNEIYNSVDFVLGRAGAGVTAECYYKKLPMFLIPLENKSSRGDQVQNACYYVACGVAEMHHEDDLTAELLLNKIKNFHANISRFKNAYNSQKIFNGKQKVVEIIKKY